MKSAALLLGLGLALAPTAWSAPGTAMRSARAQSALNARSRFAATNIRHRPRTYDDNSDFQPGLTTNLHDATSSNWAGAVLVGTNYNMVTGTFVVPPVTAPANAIPGTTYSSSAWVGIDGDTCQSTILQTGVDFSVKDGTATYTAWYEWYPHFAHNFEGFLIKEGDVIQMNVTAQDPRNGVALIYNQSTGIIVWVPFNSQTTPLCQVNAEWIVEDYSTGNNLVALSNFGTVGFTNAGTNLGGLKGATILSMVQKGTPMANCHTDLANSITCRYTGP